MRLSFIFELLLIFVFLAFAASRVIDSKGLHNLRTKSLTQKHKSKIAHHKVRQQDAINRYCSCSNNICNCCREFNIPAVSLKGPGCASLQYLNGDKLAISMSFGERVLTNTTINSRRPRPICMPLPGGVSKFCGRVYNIERKGQDFNACLGLELKALKNVEAALRVSCFRFGQDGLRVEPSQPLPPLESSTTDEEDDDDDDDDDYDDEDEFGFDDDDDDDDDDDEDDDDNDVESTDYESFSLLDDDFIDGLFTSEGDDAESTPVKKVTTTTKAPLRRVTRKPLRKVTQKPTTIKKTTRKPTSTTTTKPVKKVQTTEASTASSIISVVTSTSVVQYEKKPELIIPITNVSINEIPDSTLVEVPIPDHDSIIVITSTSDPSPVPEDTSVTSLATDATVPEPVNVVGGLINKVEYIEETPIPSNDVTLEQTSTTSVYDITVQQDTNANTPITQESETVLDEKMATTEAEVAVDDDEDENDENVQSFIVKNDDDDEAEEEEDEDDSDESDPITDVVEDVLGVEDEKRHKKKNETNVEENVKKGADKEASAESKDVIDDIIDGTADMMAIADDSDEDAVTKKSQLKKEESDEDDILDDDDDDDDSDEDDDDDDDSEDEEDEARKAKSHIRKKTRSEERKSRDMWLDRLHW